jgi:hypothetical protein
MLGPHPYVMAGYTFLHPTLYELTAIAAWLAWGVQNRLTALTALSAQYSFARPPADRPWNMSDQARRGPLICLIRLVRTLLHTGILVHRNRSSLCVAFLGMTASVLEALATITRFPS